MSTGISGSKTVLMTSMILGPAARRSAPDPPAPTCGCVGRRRAPAAAPSARVQVRRRLGGRRTAVGTAGSETAVGAAVSVAARRDLRPRLAPRRRRPCRPSRNEKIAHGYPISARHALAAPATSASTVFRRVVHRERRARRGRDAEAIHDRLRAVMAGANRDAFAIDDRADVVRMDAVHHERHDARLAPRRADDADAGHRSSALRRAVERAPLRARRSRRSRSPRT